MWLFKWLRLERVCQPWLHLQRQKGIWLEGRRHKEERCWGQLPGSSTSIVSDSCACTQVSLVPLHIPPSFKTALVITSPPPPSASCNSGSCLEPRHQESGAEITSERGDALRVKNSPRCNTGLPISAFPAVWDGADKRQAAENKARGLYAHQHHSQNG